MVLGVIIDRWFTGAVSPLGDLATSMVLFYSGQ